MADIAFGSLAKIIGIAVKIKEAVETVKQNQKECRAIQRLAIIIEAQLKRLDQMTETTKEAVNLVAMDDLAESLGNALELVNKCQRKHIVLRFIGRRGMAKELNRARMDISDKLSVGNFVNTVQITIMLTNQCATTTAAPPPLLLEEGVTAGFTCFTFSELKASTNDFSPQYIIATGGFSTVYKGVLDDGRVVAIKKIQSDHGFNENRIVNREMGCLSKFGEHKNILRTLGYCATIKEELASYEGTHVKVGRTIYYLVAEFMPNGTMNDFITHERGHIDLSSGFKMIQGIARGLHYLHQNLIVHRDLKPGNILLDSDMNPRIADFGVSRQLWRNIDDDPSTIVGTVGYMAPEYMAYGRFSGKTDVYAFGVIIIRTISSICANVPADVRAFAEWARKEQEAGRTELLDPHLERCIVAGLLCTAYDPKERPTTDDLLQILNGEKELPTQIKK